MCQFYFVKHACDLVVLEVGLGGTDDATNVIKTPEAAAIANIDFDHMGFLGKTLAQIAEKKAGIIKEAGTVVETPANIWSLGLKDAYGECVIQYLKDRMTLEDMQKRLSEF